MSKLEIDNTLANRANESANQQAARILVHLKNQLATDPNKKIGLVYAANNKQAEGMQASLDANIPLPDYLLKGGSGQAPVFMELMRLINKDPACRGKIKIIPVSTSLTGGENKPGNIVNSDIIKRDLKSLQKKLQAGYDIFAMPSGQIAGYFAIGGKASAHWFTTTHAAFQYKGQLYSQGDFVQMLINALKQDPAINMDAVFSEAKLLTGKDIARANSPEFDKAPEKAAQPGAATPPQAVPPKPIEVESPQAVPPKPVEVKLPQAEAPKPAEVKSPQAVAPKPPEVKPPQAAAPMPPSPPLQATSHQKMHGLMNVVAQQKSPGIVAKLSQKFGLLPVQMALITTNDGSMAMKVRFSDQALGQQFSNHLALMGITSNSMPGALKKIRDHVVYLTAKDLGLLNTQQRDLTTVMREIATVCLDVSPDKVTISRNNQDSSQTNVIMSFESKNEADLMSKSLFKMGVMSNSNTGNLKSITDNKIVLTVNDLVIVQQHQQAIGSYISMLKEDIVNAKSIVPSVDRYTGDTNIVMTFASKEEAEQVSKQLFNLGVASLRNSGKPKTVGNNNEIVLSQKQGVQLHQQFTAIKEEKAFLNAHIPMSVTIVPSKDAKTGQVNILTVFKSESDAKKFTQFLAERGVESNSNPGQHKTVQPGNGVILTVGDCEKLEQQLLAVRKPK